MEWIIGGVAIIAWILIVWIQHRTGNLPRSRAIFNEQFERNKAERALFEQQQKIRDEQFRLEKAENKKRFDKMCAPLYEEFGQDHGHTSAPTSLPKIADIANAFGVEGLEVVRARLNFPANAEDEPLQERALRFWKGQMGEANGLPNIAGLRVLVHLNGAYANELDPASGWGYRTVPTVEGVEIRHDGYPLIIPWEDVVFMKRAD